MDPLIDPDEIHDTTPEHVLELYRLTLNLVRDGMTVYGRDTMEQLAEKANRAGQVFLDDDGGVVASHYLIGLALCMVPLLSHMIRDDAENKRAWTPPDAVIQ